MIPWLYKNYFLVSTIVAFYLMLIGFGTYQMFYDISKITAASATAYGTLMLLPAAIMTLLRWRISKDNE